MTITPKKDKLKRYYIRIYRGPGDRPYKLLEEKGGTLTFQAAKKLAEDWVYSLRVPVVIAGRPTLSQVFYKLLEETTGFTAKNKTRCYAYLKNLFIPFFTDKAIEDLTVLDIEKYKTSRLVQDGNKGLTIQGSTINRELACLISIIHKAFELGVIKTNPLAGKKVKRLKGNSRLGNYFEMDEWQKFLAVFTDRGALLNDLKKCLRASNSPAERTAYLENASKMADLFQVQLLTCSRIGEVLNLRFSAINWKTNRISLYQPKTDSTKYQDLGKGLRSILQRLYRESKNKAGYVFTRADGQQFPIAQVERFFRTGLRLAGIQKPLVCHSIRHTACSTLVQQGVSIKKVQEIAGHKSINSTLGYSSLTPSSLNDALTVLDNLSSKEIPANGSASQNTLEVVK